MSVKKSIFKNGVAAAFQKIVKIAEQLLLVPLFIQYWGTSYYGEWLTLTIIPSFLALSDFGFGTATANTFLLKYASGDEQDAANIAKTGLWVITVFIGFIIAISLMLLNILYHFGVFDHSLIDSKDAFWAVLLLLLARVANFYQPLFEAYYRAARKANISINFQTIMSLCNMVFGAIVISNGGNSVLYAFVLFMVSLLLNPIYIYTANNALTIEKVGSIKKNEIRKLLHIGIGFFLSPIWQAIYYQGTTLVVRLTLGPIAVTIFNTIRTLIRSSSQAFAMLITAVYPDFQFELGSGNIKKAKKIFVLLFSANIIMALSFILFLGTTGQFFYALWTKQAFHIPNDVWFVFISGIIFYALWFTFSFVFEAINRPYVITISGLVFSVIVIFITWILSKQIGILGAAIGNLVFDILMCTVLVTKGFNTMQMTMKDTLVESKIQIKSIYTRIFLKIN
jgi:O-antigen/teichoic acid export membrane protein